MPQAILEIPATPPSLNSVGYRSHWAVGRRVKKEWEEMLGTALMVAQVPRGLTWACASAEIHFTARRRRDEGNFRAILEKAFGDILQSAWGLPDDTPEYYRFDRVELLCPLPEAKTVIDLRYGKDGS